MNIAVIYQSHYGFTKIYATWIAEALGAPLLQGEHMKPEDLQTYQIIVYGGGLYAGGVNGISLLTKNFESIKDKSIYLFTVGAADVREETNIDHIRSGLKKALPPDMWQAIHLYHFRGGMCYSKMSFVHRMMMKLMIKLVRKKEKSQRSVEDQMILDTYGQDVDFTDKSAVTPLLEAILAEN